MCRDSEGVQLAEVIQLKNILSMASCNAIATAAAKLQIDDWMRKNRSEILDIVTEAMYQKEYGRSK